jgi:hypothetical protein
VFKNSVEEIPRRSTETVRNEEHHNYPSTECIMIIDGNITRRGPHLSIADGTNKDYALLAYYAANSGK